MGLITGEGGEGGGGQPLPSVGFRHFLIGIGHVLLVNTFI